MLASGALRVGLTAVPPLMREAACCFESSLREGVFCLSLQKHLTQATGSKKVLAETKSHSTSHHAHQCLTVSDRSDVQSEHTCTCRTSLPSCLYGKGCFHIALTRGISEITMWIKGLPPTLSCGFGFRAK